MSRMESGEYSTHPPSLAADGVVTLTSPPETWASASNGLIGSVQRPGPGHLQCVPQPGFVRPTRQVAS